MAITYHYNEQDNLLELTLDSPLRAADVALYFKALHTDPRLQPDFVDVVHFDRVEEFLMTPQEIFQHRNLAQSLKQHRGYAGGVLICNSGLSWGIARSYQAIFSQSDVPIHVIHHYEDPLLAVRLLRANLLSETAY